MFSDDRVMDMLLSLRTKIIVSLVILVIAICLCLRIISVVQRDIDTHVVQRQEAMALIFHTSRVVSNKIEQASHAVDMMAGVVSVLWNPVEAKILQKNWLSLQHEKPLSDILIKKIKKDDPYLFFSYYKSIQQWNTTHISEALYSQWQHLYQNKKSYWSKPYYTNDHQHIISYSAPIIQNDTLIGMVTTHLDLHNIEKLFSTDNKHLKMALLSEEGNFILKSPGFNYSLAKTSLDHHQRNFLPIAENSEKSLIWLPGNHDKPALLSLLVPMNNRFIVAYSLDYAQWEHYLSGANMVWIFVMLAGLVMVLFAAKYINNRHVFFLSAQMEDRCFYFSYDANNRISSLSQSFYDLLGDSATTYVTSVADSLMQQCLLTEKEQGYHRITVKDKAGHHCHLFLYRKPRSTIFGKKMGGDGLGVCITDEINDGTYVLDASLHPMLMMTDHGTVEAINEHAEKFFGIPESALLNIAFTHLIAEEDRNRFLYYIHRLQSAVLTDVLEVQITIHNQIVPVEISLMFFDVNRKSMIFGIYDITDRKQADKALKTSEQRYRSLVEGLQKEYFFYSRDTEGCYHYVSPSVFSILGYSRNQFQRYNYQYLSANVLNDPIKKQVNSPVMAHSGLAHICEFLHTDGSMRTLEILEISTLDAHQQIIAVEGIVRDITRQQHLEDALSKARDYAEEAFLSKSRFLSNMSHELRTPLNGMLGYAQLMQNDQTLNQNHLNKLKIIMRCGKHLLNLLNNVLNVSKIEHTSTELNETDIAIDDIINDVRHMVASKVDETRIQVLFERHDIVYDKIRIDATRLIQVLINLVDNAIKFTHQGSVKLTISQYEEKLCFAVQDTGPGIEKKDLAVIFEPFQQITNDFSSQGVGLGLAISHHLVHMLGGVLNATSRPSKGSCFKFSLPLKPALGENPPLVTADLACSAWMLDESCHPQILIVDAHASDRYVLQSLLKQAGFLTLCAEHGVEALQMLHQYDFELVLTDIDMPIMDGFILYEAIQKDERLQKVKVFAVTADHSLAMCQKINDLGFHAYLRKPYSVVDMLGSIAKHLKVRYKNSDTFEPLNCQLDQLVRLLSEEEQDYLQQHLGDVLMAGDIAGVGNLVNALKQRWGISMLTQFLDQCWLDYDLEKLDRLMDIIASNQDKSR